jgi:hypothetical protein
MTDYVWPDDLVPYQQSFYLQPHTGGTESPFSRVSKVYGLSAPRWMCSMSFRGGYNGLVGLEAYGPRLDALIAKLKGRQNRIAIQDFRRDAMRGSYWPSGAGNLSAALGATSMTLTGLTPGLKIYAGNYLGGDGRPHIIIDDVIVDSSGQAVVNFEPPLKSTVGVNSAIFSDVTAIFRLVDDDAGINGVEVGSGIDMILQFAEDLQ